LSLEGLVQARLQMQDGRGAITPLGKLVQLHPERQDDKLLSYCLHQLIKRWCKE